MSNPPQRRRWITAPEEIEPVPQAFGIIPQYDEKGALVAFTVEDPEADVIRKRSTLIEKIHQEYPGSGFNTVEDWWGAAKGSGFLFKVTKLEPLMDNVESTGEKPRYPKLVVDLSRADYLFGVESKVHGQMKAHGLPREVRREFTKEIQQAKTFEEQVAIARRWVTVKGAQKVSPSPLEIRERITARCDVKS